MTTMYISIRILPGIFMLLPLDYQNNIQRNKTFKAMSFTLGVYFCMAANIGIIGGQSPELSSQLWLLQLNTIAG